MIRLVAAILGLAWLLGFSGVSRSEPHLASQLRASLAMVSLAAPATESPPPRLDDGSRIAAPRDRGNVAPDDQRPLYVAVGIIVLAAVFWWNRRQRDRFDLEDGRSDTTTTGHRGDDDADDLHAAARGETQSRGSEIDKLERRGVGTAPPAGSPEGGRTSPVGSFNDVERRGLGAAPPAGPLEGERASPVGSFDRTPPESGPKSGQGPD
jgi:hypothetical protein